MGSRVLAQDDLHTGRLVAPFELTIEDMAYYIVYPRGALSRANVKAFRDWLLEEARGEATPRGCAQATSRET